MTERLTLPWHNDDPYPDVVLDKNGHEVASFCDIEDCKFTVKAVNNHDALVRALVSISDPLKLDVDGIGIARTLNLINRMASLAKDALVDVQRDGDPVGCSLTQGERS